MATIAQRVAVANHGTLIDEDETNGVNIHEKIKNGQFLPAVEASERGLFDVTSEVDGRTMLHFAAFYGHIKAIRYCLMKISQSPDEADLEKSLLSRSKEGDTPLLLAIESGELPSFWLLLNE